MADADGLDEAAEQLLRVGLTAAAQLAEQIAQARAQTQREAATRSDREARDLATRVDAERAATAQLDRTRDPRWIETATAHQWAPTDPAAARDAQRILDQVRARYGPDAVPTNLDRTPEAGRGGGVDSPSRRAAAADAALLLAAPDVETGVQAWLAEHPEPLPGLSTAQTTEAVDARLRAALFQATPATAGTTTRTPGAEQARPAGPVVDLNRAAEVERD